MLANDSFFDSHNWQNIEPPGGRNSSLTKSTYTDRFYVRPIAAWIPHLLIPNHVPCCPRCGKRDLVEVKKGARFINSPKILYGMSSHRYLDTILYPCSRCKRRFSGYDRTSLAYDAEKMMGFFNFHLGKKFAVDEMLYSFITASYKVPTSQIYQQLVDMTTDRCLRDYQYYLHAIRVNKIRVERPDRSDADHQQETLDKHLQADKRSPAERTLQDLHKRKRDLSLGITAAVAHNNDPIHFDSLERLKSNRNNRDPLLPSLGTKKLRDLREAGIASGRELVDYVGVPPRWAHCRKKSDVFEKWRCQVSEEFLNRQRALVKLQRQATRLEEQIEEASNNVAVEQCVAEQIAEEEGADSSDTPTTDTATEDIPERPLLFSKMKDPRGYNARMLSLSRIESIQMTEFLHRKPMQLSKMVCLPSKILKFDFEYKIPKKVHVYQGRGKSFKPYKNLLVVQNENCQTVFWKIGIGSESISSIEKSLRELKERNPEEVECIYIDRCCDWRPRLKAIFPNALILLDVFHWDKRWDGLLAEPTSMEAKTFRGLLKRATFVVEPTEYERAKSVVKQRLTKAKKLTADEQPTHRQIMKEARSVIPPPATLRDNAMAVLRYIFMFDLSIEVRKATRNADDQSELPRPFFKPLNAKLRDLLNQQMLHIDSGCLSDPENLQLHRQNAKTKVMYTARGTSSVENGNLYLDALTGKAIGIARADRLLGTFFEIDNDRKRINRLGEWAGYDIFTHRTERLAMLNSLAKSAGYNDAELPYPDLNLPPLLKNVIAKAEMGFDLTPVTFGSAPDVLTRMQKEAADGAPINPATNQAAALGTVAEDTDEEEAEEQTNETDDPNKEEEPSEEDIELASFLEEVDNLREDDDGELDVTVARLLPEIQQRETTMEAFKRLTSQQPWIPFHAGAGPKTKIDMEEEALFEQMKERHRRHVAPSAPKGYLEFETAWNIEVANRYRRSIEEGEDIILIHRKSREQLAEHFDRQQQLLATSARAEVQNAGPTQLDNLNAALRHNRQDLPALGPVQQAQPVRYPQTGPMPIGRPMTLNSEVVAYGLRLAATRQPAPWLIAAATTQRPQRSVLDGFNVRRWCQTCGSRRCNHIVRDEGFGRKCRRDWCGKCYRLKKYHKDGMMGPHCTNPPSSHSCHKEWYLKASSRSRVLLLI